MRGWGGGGCFRFCISFPVESAADLLLLTFFSHFYVSCNFSKLLYGTKNFKDIKYFQ